MTVNDKTQAISEEKDQLLGAGRAKNPTRKPPIRDFIMNGYDIPPRYVQYSVDRVKYGVIGGGGYGAYRFQDNQKPVPMKKLYPHRHSCTEYFIFYGTNPDDPDDMGGKVEYWIGDGKDAEPYILTKPTIVILPPNTTHLPEVYRGYHGLNAQAVVHDAPLWSLYDVDTLPPVFNVHKQVDTSKFTRKYQNCVMERDISKAAYFPSHEGKSHVILHMDMRHSELTTHYFEANLIYGSGIGWGCGDIMQYTDYYSRSLPHLHDTLETYWFMGTDPNNPNDLGGTLEFWLGEGQNAEKITITKPTTLFIPPNTVHLPLYVKELHTPIITTNMLDSILWTGHYIDTFPPEFDHIYTPTVEESKQMKIHLAHNKEKCLYPKCGMCMDVCQLNGIDVSITPVRLGDPCMSCGQCAMMCPTGAIQVLGLIEDDQA